MLGHGELLEPLRNLLHHNSQMEFIVAGWKNLIKRSGLQRNLDGM